jgi:hypothetical protein
MKIITYIAIATAVGISTASAAQAVGKKILVLLATSGRNRAIFLKEEIDDLCDGPYISDSAG